MTLSTLSLNFCFPYILVLACVFACRFHCPVEFPGLISWVLSQQGLKIFRAMIIMARGPYEHTPWSSDGGYVVAPSIYGY